MKLSTGKIAFPIEFDNGDKEFIYFNPNDPDLGDRLLNIKDILSKRVEEISSEDIQLAFDGEPIEMSDVKEFESLSAEEQDKIRKKAEHSTSIMKEMKKIICEELDTAFGGSISSVVFKHCSPFAIVNGEYFVLQFIRAITPEIEAQITESNKRTQAKMQKHIGKYTK